jgi:hypothetical protein
MNKALIVYLKSIRHRKFLSYMKRVYKKPIRCPCCKEEFVGKNSQREINVDRWFKRTMIIIGLSGVGSLVGLFLEVYEVVSSQCMQWFFLGVIYSAFINVHDHWKSRGQLKGTG